MTRTPRWIAGATAEADRLRVRVPWERGLRRAAFIRRREVGASRPSAPATHAQPTLRPALLPVAQAS